MSSASSSSAPPPRVDPKSIGQRLLAAGEITRIQLTYALQKQRVSLERLGELLLRLGLVSEASVARILAEQHGLRYVAPQDCPRAQRDAQALFKPEICLAQGMLPLEIDGGTLTLAVGNADPRAVEAFIQRRTGLRSRMLQVDFSLVRKRLAEDDQGGNAAAEQVFTREYDKLNRDAQSALSTDDLVNSLLQMAVAERATDIHVQPEARTIHLSMRIDGVLLPVFCMARAMARLTAAVKVRAGMDIANTLTPQDGRFSADVDDQPYDIRVSTSVTPHGESMVLRLLPNGAYVNGLDQLGFLPEHRQRLATLFAQPHGMVLMTGPTGSGKTTTMYAGLKSQGLTGKSVLTVEDPIEYVLPFAIQTQVNRKSGYTFDKAVTHFLRHDPDIMLVGEIRDRETAEVAVRAAETGHLVLSTLHVNSAYSVLGRLGALGISNRMMADSLIGVVNQRLARRLCDACKTPDVAAPAPEASAFEKALAGVPVYRPVGCAACRQTGYSGRVPIYEILTVSPRVVAMIEASATRQAFNAELGDEEYVSMGALARRRVLDGETSLAEVGRLFGALLQAD